MIVYTDNIALARRYFGIDGFWIKNHTDLHLDKKIFESFFPNSNLFSTEISNSKWEYLFIVENAEKSQFDVFTELISIVELPDRFLCAAVTGKKFHGFRGREWYSLPGNIHLSVYLKPECIVTNITAGFLLLSTVSVLQTIDSIKFLKNRAKVKWVNDIIIDNAKVSGVITHTQVQASIVKGAVLGIGLNVESAPELTGDNFVKKAGCLNEFLPPEQRVNCSDIFHVLIDKLSNNYLALKEGEYFRLLDIYRNKSIVINKEIFVYSDEIDGTNELITFGKVIGISDNLELILENTHNRINKGRIIING